MWRQYWGNLRHVQARHGAGFCSRPSSALRHRVEEQAWGARPVVASLEHCDVRSQGFAHGLVDPCRGEARVLGPALAHFIGGMTATLVALPELPV